MDPEAWQILTLLSGAAVALLPIAVWEQWLKPRREREHLARLLFHELALNFISLKTWRSGPSKQLATAATTVHCSRVGFDAVVSRLGELTPSEAIASIKFYRSLEQLERVRADFMRCREETRSIWLDEKGRPRELTDHGVDLHQELVLLSDERMIRQSGLFLTTLEQAEADCLAALCELKPRVRLTLPAEGVPLTREERVALLTGEVEATDAPEAIKRIVHKQPALIELESVKDSQY